MLVDLAAGRDWKPTDYAGIERSPFRNNESGGRSSVLRMARGTRFPRHAHHGTEEVVVLAGIVRISAHELTTSPARAVTGRADVPARLERG